jgi:hypothetical protein
LPEPAAKAEGRGSPPVKIALAINEISDNILLGDNDRAIEMINILLSETGLVQ